MKLLHIQKRDNVEFYLFCKFQLSPFSVRRKTDVKNGVTDKQTNKLPYASALGIIKAFVLVLKHFYKCLKLCFKHLSKCLPQPCSQ